MGDHVSGDVGARKDVESGVPPWQGLIYLRRISYGFGAAAVFTSVLSAYFLAFYESLGQQVLLRNRPAFVQSVTYSAMLACVFGICCFATYQAARGKRTRAGWVVVWGCMALLNFYSLWSSRAIMDLLSPLISQAYLFPLQSYGFGFGIFGNLPVDLISAALIVIVSSAGYFIYRSNGLGARMLRVVQLASLCVIPLPVYVLLSDTSEFSLHVTSFQEHYGVLQWFTNADLLVLAASLFVGSTVLLSRKRSSGR